MKKYRVNVNGTEYEIALELISDDEATASNQPKKEASAPASAPTSAPAGGEKVNAPMPGTILDIKVSDGSSVKAGDVIMILEAMKMENEILAPSDGKVSITTTKGATVKTGDLLCVIE